MARRLAYPWLGVLDEVELAAAAHGAVLLGLNVDLDARAEGSAAADPSSGGVVGQSLAAPVRLQATLASDGAALTWAAALPQGRWLSRAPLSTPFATARGSYGLKAQAQAVMPQGVAAVPLTGSVPLVAPAGVKR